LTKECHAYGGAGGLTTGVRKSLRSASCTGGSGQTPPETPNTGEEAGDGTIVCDSLQKSVNCADTTTVLGTLFIVDVKNVEAAHTSCTEYCASTAGTKCCSLDKPNQVCTAYGTGGVVTGTKNAIRSAICEMDSNGAEVGPTPAPTTAAPITSCEKLTLGVGCEDTSVILQHQLIINVDKAALAAKECAVRCAFSDRSLHSRMPLDPTHVRLKRTRV
jgi:hypothetical protein